MSIHHLVRPAMGPGGRPWPGVLSIKATVIALERSSWPAASIIGEILKRAGLTVLRKYRRKATPSQSPPLSHAAAANQVWSADFKGWFRCGDGIRCDPGTQRASTNRWHASMQRPRKRGFKALG